MFSFVSPRNLDQGLPRLSQYNEEKTAKGASDELSRGSVLERFGKLAPTYEYHNLSLPFARTIRPVIQPRTNLAEEAFSKTI